VGSGLLDRLTPQSAGVKDLRRRIKELVNTDKAEAKGKVKNNGNTNTVENPPNLLGMKQVVGVGFSTPFPEGIPLRGLLFLTIKTEVEHDGKKKRRRKTEPFNDGAGSSRKGNRIRQYGPLLASNWDSSICEGRQISQDLVLGVPKAFQKTVLPLGLTG
jgi:hypothetical protein